MLKFKFSLVNFSAINSLTKKHLAKLLICFRRLFMKILNFIILALMQTNFIITSANFIFTSENNYTVPITGPINRPINKKYKFDATIISEINFRGGLTRIGISVAEMLEPYLKVNFVRAARSKMEIPDDIKPEVRAIFSSADKSPGAVSLFTDTFDNSKAHLTYNKVDSKIKIAYSMLESTRIPVSWVKTINRDFDAIAVPDQFLVKVYEDSGVNVPIFTVPIGMYLKDFLTFPVKSKKNKIFTFGVAATFIDRKNNSKLLSAFIEEFGNNSNFLLKIHGRGGDSPKYLEEIVKKLNIKNVKITQGAIAQDKYVDFLRSIDCYVYISKGEGFSLTPREAMALGIPCIITNNTAQTTICNSGLVEVVPSNIKEPFNLRGEFAGYCFDCQISAVRAALKKVYNNYQKYLSKSSLARKWAKQYDLNNISKYYVSLVKPKAVILGKRNIVTPSYLETNSKELYNKYLEIINN